MAESVYAIDLKSIGEIYRGSSPLSPTKIQTLLHNAVIRCSFYMEIKIMNQKTQWQNHPSNPAAQPFQLSGRKNLTKKRAWWQLGNTNNPGSKKKQKDAE